MWCVFQEHKQFLLGTGTDSSPMRSNSVLEGHFMISSDSRGQGGRHLQEVHWHTLDVWNSLGSVLGTKIKVSPHRLCLSLGEGQPLLCLNSPGCHRAQESILDYKIKRGDLNQCSLNMHIIAVFAWRFIQKEATNLDFWLFGLCTTSCSIWKHLCSSTWCPVWTWWWPFGCGAPGQVPNCPYGLSGLVIWTMLLQYVDQAIAYLYSWVCFWSFL